MRRVKLRYDIGHLSVLDLEAMQGKESFDAKLDKISVLISVVFGALYIFPCLVIDWLFDLCARFFLITCCIKFFCSSSCPELFFVIGGYRTHGNRIMGVPALVGISCLGIEVTSTIMLR